MKNKVISIMVIILFLSTYLTNAVLGATKTELENEQARIEEERRQAEQEKNNIANQKKNEQDDLEVITEELSALNNEILSLESQLNSLNDSITEKTNEIDAKQKELTEKEELLKKRLVSIYKNGGISYLDVLLGATNYMDLLASIDALERIADADTKLINKVTDEKKALEDAKAELEAKKKEVDAVKAQKDAKNVELTSKQREKQSLINSLNQEEKAKQSEIDEYNAAMARVNQQLADIARQAQAQLNGGGNGQSGLKFDGSFIWPCNNKVVTSTVKQRWGRMHKGIDIGASYENVYASATGYAYNAYDRYGYGNYIMVFHGSGYVTLYGHLSVSKVYNGQFVTQGQVIATSGNTGSSTAPHLHFEIRQASSTVEFFSKGPLNPLDYLPGGYTMAAGAATPS